METELTIKGTPYDFGIMAREFSDELENAKSHFSFSLKSTFPSWAIRKLQDPPLFTAETNPVTVHIQSAYPPIINGKRDAVMVYGEIKAHKLPDGKSRVRVLPYDKYLQEFQQGWELLRAEMERQGWFDAPSDSMSEQMRQQSQRTSTLTPKEIDHLDKASKQGGLLARRKVIIGLLLILSVAVVLFVLTLLVVSGILPWQVAVVLFVLGVAIERATTWVGAWNNILSLVEKLFDNKTIAKNEMTENEIPLKEEKPMPSDTLPISGSAPSTYTCFISHSHEDEEFCAKLSAHLRSHGIKVWRFAEDAKWGETVWGEITDHIQANDKLIVVCSVNSLTSSPVSREMERALGREDTEHKNVLFPIRIDDYIFAKDAQGNDKWQHPRRADVVAKVVGDFSGWDKDAAKYDKAFDKLLKGLQAS